MIRAACVAVVSLAACNLGIGSDPNAHPWPCRVGNVRDVPTAQCAAPRATIVADGNADDWAEILPVPVAGSCLAPPCMGLEPAALEVAADPEPALAVRVSFAASPRSDPSLRVVVTLASSPARPATHSIDRLIVHGDTVRYEKNGWAATSPTTPYAAAWLQRGLELRIADRWLTLQGVAELGVSIERQVGGNWTTIAQSEAITACWAGIEAQLDGSCEVPPQ